MESNTKEIEESLTYAYENKYILLFHNRKKYLFCPLCWRVYDRHALEGEGHIKRAHGGMSDKLLREWRIQLYKYCEGWYYLAKDI